MSSTTLVRPQRSRWRRRLTALAVTLALGAAGLTAAAAPAYADAVVQITGPTSPVVVGTSYTYTISVQGVPNDVGIGLTLDLLMGDNVTITGSDSEYCSFNGSEAACEDFPSMSATYTFTVLAVAPGPVVATVTATGDVYGTDTTVTTLIPSPFIPTVTSVSPSFGTVFGGTPVTITGTNLSDTTAIDFGGVDIPASSCTATSCTVISPSYPTFGTIDVQVTNPEGTSAISAGDEFTFKYIAIAETLTSEGFGTVATAGFNTFGSQLLVAFISSDGPGTRQTTSVTGGGLTWTLAQRANTEGGTAEIWTAYAAGSLTDAVVTSVPKTQGYAQLLTVEVLAGASGVGAGAVAGKVGGTPRVTVTTTTPASWVFAVGEDYSHDTTITPGPGQVLLQDYLDTTNHDTFWVQNQNQGAAAAAGIGVTMNDTAPTHDAWNLAAVEILPSTN